jgi:thymidylate synthase
MNKIDIAYQDLLKDILENGVEKETRNGKTISVFGRQIRYKFKDGKFPLLTTKKMAFKTMVTELLWFLRGDTNIKYLVDNGCHIWDGDAYKNYMTHWAEKLPRIGPCTQEEFIERIKTDPEFAKKWGELGPLYGKQWRAWNHFISTGDPIIESVESEDSIAVSVTPQGIECEIDQIKNLIKDLKANPDSRRLMVSAWNPAEIEAAVLPPCHYGFQVYTRELTMDERLVNSKLSNKTDLLKDRDLCEEAEKELSTILDLYNTPKRAISLMYNARSQDVPLGTPFNISSYALLLEIIAKMVNMIPDELISNMGDCHIYLNQVDGVKEQLTRESYDLPKVVHRKTDDFYKSLSEDFSLITHLESSDFEVEGYKSHPTIKIPLSN